MKKKNIYLIISSILIVISIILFIVSFIHSNYDLDSKEALLKLIKKNNVHDFTITKNTSKMDENNYFEETDYDYIRNKIDSELKEVYIVYDDRLKFEFQYECDASNEKAYYMFRLSNYFQIVDDWSKVKLIGNVPSKSNEIVISKLNADRMIKLGVQVKDGDKTKLYKPRNYDELLKSKKEIVSIINGTSLIVTGIMDDDMSKYSVLKHLNYTYPEINVFKRLQRRFSDDMGVAGNLNMIYVSNDFFDKTEFLENNELISGYRYLSHKIGDKYVTPQGFIQYPTHEVKYFDGEKIVTTDHLNRDEAIIYYPYLKSYIGSNSFEDVRKEIMKNCDPYLELEECTFKFLNDNNIIGSTIDVMITDTSLAVTGNEKNYYNNIKIIGYTVLDEFWAPFEYYSKDLLGPYMLDEKEVIALRVHEEDYKKIEKIINNFDIEPVYDKDNVHYYVNTIYNSEVLSMKYILEEESNMMRIISGILFAIAIGLILIKNRKRLFNNKHIFMKK